MPFKYVPHRRKDVVRCPICGVEKDIERHVEMKAMRGDPLHKELLELFYKTWKELAELCGNPNLDYNIVWRATIKKYMELKRGEQL